MGIRRAHRHWQITLLLLALVGPIPAAQTATLAADTLIYNADIRTVDPDQPLVSAMAIQQGRVIALGNRTTLSGYVNDKTQLIDAAGHTVLPGLIDAHVHLMSGAGLLQGVDLYGIKDRDVWFERIAERDKSLSKGQWLVGGLWDHTIADQPLPTRQELDAVLPDRPAILTDVDGHSVWVNTLALKLSGITADTEAPADGVIVLDDSGEPSGILLEGAAQLVRESDAYQQATQLDEAARLSLIENIVAHANSLGLTGAHEMNERPALDDYERLMAANRLNLRLWFGTTGEYVDRNTADQLRKRADSLAAHPGNTRSGPNLELGYIKLFIDGVLSTRTAVLLEPYTDRPGERGLPILPPQDLLPAVAAANQADLPVAIHAIGDGAVRLALDSFEASPKRPSRPNRIEHIELIDPEDIPRFNELNVVASVNPHHAVTTFHNYLRDRIGKSREPYAYAWNKFAEADVPIVLGSDWYTAPLNPLVQIWAAVFREDAFGKVPGKWHPENALTFEQALFGYTQEPANISGWGEQIGSLSPGKWADFVVLDRQLATPVTPALRTTKVASTWIAGQPVYQATQPANR